MTASIGGRYRLEAMIGRGASAQVWRARDVTLDRVVALKRLGLPHGVDAGVDTTVDAAVEEDHRRTLREAHLAARLSHPHIVTVLDLVTDGDGADWLVMEHVDGRDLAAFVRENGPLGPDEAARYLGQVAGALAAAHAAGIVHRDVKPSNILLRSDDQALLSDFGIARATADPTLTRTGLVTGSPAYLAPEVASGASATPASDAWSWGATLYHLLTGRSPYAVDGEDQHVLGTLYRIVNEPPPRLDGAPWPAALLEVTLTHDPAQRWDLARLQQALATGPSAARDLPGAATATTVIPAPTSIPRAQPAVGTGPRAASAEASPEATAVLTAARVPPAAPMPAPAATMTARARKRRGPALAVGAVLAVVLLFLGIRAVVGDGSGDTPTASGSSGASGSSTDGSGASDAEPSADAMASFAESYVRTASDDPAAGYRLLTPAYQRASGGLSGYRSFWSRVVQVKSLSDVRADPSELTVSYRYVYILRGAGPRTEDVRLRLEYRRDGSFRISGAV